MQEGAGAWGAAGPHLNCSLQLPSPSSSARATTTATKATCGQQMFKNKSSRCSMLHLLVALVAVSIVVVAVVVFLRFGIEFNDQKWKAAKNICVAQSVNAMAKLNPPRQPCVWGRRRWRRRGRGRGHWYGAAVADCRFMHYNMQLASLSSLQPDAAVSTYCAMQFAFAAAPHFTTWYPFEWRVNHKFLNAMPKSTRSNRGHSLSLGTKK